MRPDLLIQLLLTRRWRSRLLVLCTLFLWGSLTVIAQPGHPAAAPVSGNPPLVPYQPKSHEAAVPQKVELPPPINWPSDIPNAPINADEAARMALAHQGNITIARFNIQAAQGVTQQQRSAALPSLTVGTTYTDVLGLLSPSKSSAAVASTATTSTTTLSGTGVPTSGGVSTTGGVATTSGSNAAVTSGTSSSVTSSSNPYTLTASVRQLLWDFNHTRDLIAQDAELEKAAAANLTQTQSDCVYNTKQAYYNWVQADRLVAVNESNVIDEQEHLKQARGLFAAGTGLASDVTAAETVVSDAVLNLTSAQVNASIARVNLALQMGIDPRIPLRASASSETTVNTSDPQLLFTLALQQRPEIQAVEAEIRSDDFGVRAAHTTSAPVLSGSVQYSAVGDRLYPQTQVANFLLGLSWTAYDGGLTAGRVKLNKANLGIAQPTLQNYRVSIVSDVAQAYLNLKTAQQKLVASRAEVESGEETVRLNTGRYRVGLGIFLNVLDAEENLLEARANLVNAQAALDLSKAALNHAMGMPLPSGQAPPLSTHQPSNDVPQPRQPNHTPTP